MTDRLALPGGFLIFTEDEFSVISAGAVCFTAPAICCCQQRPFIPAIPENREPPAEITSPVIHGELT